MYMNHMIALFIRFLSTIALISLLAGKADAAEGNYRRTIDNYTVPDVVLINQDGHKIHLKEYLQSNKPVVVEFIYATCTTFCPILSAGYVNLQQKLGVESPDVTLVSISIDPENDSPNVMKDYLKRYRSKPGWDFLTGSRTDIDTVLHAFKAYIPNKVSHFPLTLIKSPSDGTWVRIAGLLSSSEFLNEFKKVRLK